MATTLPGGGIVVASVNGLAGPHGDIGRRQALHKLQPVQVTPPTFITVQRRFVDGAQGRVD
jgi:hypothetical protein